MKKWYSNKASPQYLSSTSIFQKHKALERLFQDFDDDGSGTLDANELSEMLNKDGI